MIDWLEIATTSVSLLTFFTKKIGGGLGEKIGKEIYNFLKRKFKKDEEASNVLNSFCQNPKRYKIALIDVIEDKAENDHEFGDSLIKFLEKVKDVSTSGDNTQLIIGNRNVMAGNQSTAVVIIDEDDELAFKQKKKT